VWRSSIRSFSWPEITKDLTRRPYIIMGFSALLLLLPLAITSTNGMMRRLKRRWQTLHRLIYLIGILGDGTSGGRSRRISACRSAMPRCSLCCWDGGCGSSATHLGSEP
jgi:hypothetical protein